MNADSEYQHYLKAKGTILGELGLKDVALRREDALIAIDLLRKSFVPVLGGDVYFRQDSKITLAYANWYSEPKADEAAADFSLRSCAEADAYIKRFPDVPGKETLFVLVEKKQ